MNKLARYLVAIVASAASMSFAADIPPEGATLVDLTTPSTTCTYECSKTPNVFKPFNDSTSLTDTSNRVLANTTSITVICDFGEGNEQAVNCYRLYMFSNGCNNRTPGAWTLYGSNDGVEWTRLDSRSGETGWQNLESRFFKFDNSAKYRYYKQAFTATSGATDYIQFSHLEYFHYADYHVAEPLLTDVGSGVWRFTGKIVDIESGDVKLVFSAADASDVEMNIGAYARGSDVSFDFSPQTEGLSLSAFNTVKIVVPDGSDGTETIIPGNFYFCGYATDCHEFHYKLDLTPSSEIVSTIGDGTYADFPVLVRLSTAISGFDYSVFSWAGADMMFTDENGTPLEFEVEGWNPHGESFVWVKVPSLSKDTRIVCYFGCARPSAKIQNLGSVWSRYVGVWHFAASEAGGTSVADATGHALDGTAETVLSTCDGPFGGSALVSSSSIKAPDFEPTHSVGATFTASGWFKCPAYTGVSGAYDSFVSKKVGLSWNASTGWYIQMNQSKTSMGIVLSGFEYKATIPDVTKNWNHYTVVSGGGNVKVYVNGAATPVIDRSYTIAASATQYLIGGSGNCEDEYRIRKGAASAEETVLEYRTMADASFFGYGTVESMDDTAPIIATPDVIRNSDGSYTISATISENSPKAGSVKCLIGTREYAMSGSGIGAYSVTVSDLAAGTYTCLVSAESAAGTVIQRTSPTVFYAGDIGIEFGQDADEEGLAAGWLTVSRADIANDLTVAFDVDASSTAVAGRTYVPVSSPIVIPDGTNEARIVITPKMDAETDQDTTVKISLVAGMYGIDASKASAQLTIVNLVSPAGWNTWVAPIAGKASDSANWSAGRAPIATDSVLFDGRFSTADCEWDADATHTVAAWKQDNGYTGTVEFDTEFPTYESATFPLFTIDGDCEILSGCWTHRGNYNNYGAASESSTSKLSGKRWCLNAIIGGDLMVASGASIDTTGKGFGHAGNQATPCYGGYGFEAAQACAPYGSVREPFDPGMGCRSQGDQNGRRSGIGGGAVKLVVAGDVTVDGSILAVGTIDMNVPRSGGTGGSIWIDANQISGNGKIDASACPPSNFTSDQAVAPGSGGRMALYTKSSLAMARGNLACNGASYRGTYSYSSTKIGSAGTIFIKDPSLENGILFLKQDPSVATTTSANAAVPLMDDMTLDGVVLSGNVVLAVEVGKTLTLPGGFASVLSSAGSVGMNGISARGGTIDVGSGNQTISGWMLEPVSNFTFAADVALVDHGGIGIIKRNICGTGDAPLPPRAVSFSVGGDMSIDATSAVDVGNVVGYTHYAGGKMGGWYAGWTTYYNGNGNQTDAHRKTYGSVFNPHDAGSSPTRSYLAGGALDMTVAGNLDMLGKVTASGPFSDNTTDGAAPSSGGSVLLTAGSISGTGSIDACGGGGRYAYAGGAGGGRVAIRLTSANATLPDTIAVNAQGRYGYAFNAKATKLGSAGTIYVETAGEAAKCGTITISNWKDRAIADFTSATVLPTTPIVAYNDGDAVADFKKASLVVTNNAIAEVSVPTLRMECATVAAKSRLDLNGNALVVKKARIGGIKVPVGRYVLAAGEESSDYPGLVNSSQEEPGTLEVLTSGLIVIFK